MVLGCSHLLSLVEEIKAKLPAALASHDLAGTIVYNASGVSYYLIQLNKFLRRKHPLARPQKLVLAKIVLDVILSEAVLASWSVHTTALGVLNSLIRKKDLKFEIPWRPLYDALVAKHFPEEGLSGWSPHASKKHHLQAFVGLVKKARFYFPPSATAEILEELNPELNPYQTRFFKAQSLLILFLPTNNPDLCRSWLGPFMEAKEWLAVCKGSSGLWLRLLSRTAKHAVGSVDFAPYLPDIFNSYLQMMELKIGGSSPIHLEHFPKKFDLERHQKRWKRKSFSRSMAKLVVYCLHIPATSILLAQLINSIKTYYHPSNTGRHTRSLASFLKHLAVYYTKRLAREQSRKLNLEIPKGCRLDPEDDSFVKCLMPVCMLGLYAKHELLCMASQQVLRCFTFTHAKVVVPVLMSTFYSDLQNVLRPHRTRTTLQCMSHILPPLTDHRYCAAGASHLEQLMWLALPGIDAIDFDKTNRTLGFFRMIFFNIPLIDAREFKGKREGGNGKFDDARRATMCFEEWSVAFVDRIVALLNNLEKHKAESFLDRAFVAILNRTARAFLSALSPKLLKTATGRLFKAVLSPRSTAAYKYYGAVAQNATFVSPAVGLDTCFPLVYSRVIGRDFKRLEQLKGSDKDCKLDSSGKERIRYFVYLLSQLVKRTGEQIIPYLPYVRAVYRITRSSDDKKIRKFGGRVLRNTLRALTQIYPREYRSFAPSKWEDPSWQHWKEWSSFEDYENLEIDWHSPSPAEMNAAAELAREALKDPVQCVNGFGRPSAEASSASAERLRNSLRDIRNVIRGCNSALGDFDGAELPRPKDEFAASGVAVKPFSLRVMPTLKGFEASVSVRSYLAKAVAGLAKSLLSEAKDVGDQKARGVGGLLSNPRVMSTLAKVSGLLLNLNVTNVEKMMHHKRVNKYFRDYYRDYVGEKKCTMRPFLVQKAYLEHQDRANTWGYKLRHTQDAQDLIDCLQRLCLLEFEKVQKHAKIQLQSALITYPWARDTVLGKMFKVVESSSSTEKQLLGSLKVMVKGNMHRHMTVNWARLLSTVEVLCGHSQQHKDDKVQESNHHFYQVLMSNFRVPAATVDPARELGGATSGASRGSARMSEERAQALRSQIQREREGCVAFTAMLTKLLDVDEDAIHWRYRLMGTSFLIAVTLATAKCSPGTVRVLMKGILSKAATLRNLCICGLGALLQKHMRPLIASSSFSSPDKVAISLDDLTKQIDSEEGWEDEKLLDDGYSGWRGQTIKVFGGRRSWSWMLDEKCTSELEAFLGKNMKAFISALEEDHPLLTQAGKKKRKDGAGESILQAVMINVHLQTDHSHSRFSAVSQNGFEVAHVHLLMRLLHRFPNLACSDGESQCTAAEIFAAIVLHGARGSLSDSKASQKVAQPVLDRVLAKCQPDCISMWMDALRCTLSDTHPARVAWVTKSLLGSVFRPENLVHSPTQFRSLKFLQAPLVEFGWRAEALSSHIISELKKYLFLSHPYKQVREEVSKILFLASANVFVCGSKSEGRRVSPMLRAFVEELRVELTAAQEQEDLFKQENDDKGNETEERVLKRQKVQEKSTNLSETIIYWVIHTINRGYPVYDLFVPLMPNLLKMQHHKAVETADIAKYFANVCAWASWSFKGKFIEAKEGGDGAELVEKEGVICMLQALKKTAKLLPWHLRKDVLNFMKVFVPRHSLLFNVADISVEECPKSLKSATSFIVKMLGDPQVEVRDAAAKALLSLLGSTDLPNAKIHGSLDSQRVAKLKKKLFRWAKTPLPPAVRGTKKDEKSQEARKNRSEALIKRHSGILGMCAMVQTQPYDVPDWLPHILGTIASHVSDPAPIRTCVKKVVSEFMRTHEDEWETKFKTKFDEDQIRRINDISNSSQSYFA